MKKQKSGYHFKLTMQHAQYDVLYKTIFSTECVMAVFTLQKKNHSVGYCRVKRAMETADWKRSVIYFKFI